MYATAVISSVAHKCERPSCTSEGQSRLVSLALWGSPDRCLWLCPDDYQRWERAYQRQAENAERPGGERFVKVVGWEVWLQDQGRQDFEDGKQPA